MRKKVPSFPTMKPTCIPLVKQESRTIGNSTCWMEVKVQAGAAKRSEKWKTLGH